MRAFNNEFKHGLPNDDATFFYIKTNDYVIPFKAFAFKKETGQMRVQVTLTGGNKVYMDVKETDEVYYTTNVLHLSDYSHNLENLNSSFVPLGPRPSPTP